MLLVPSNSPVANIFFSFSSRSMKILLEPMCDLGIDKLCKNFDLLYEKMEDILFQMEIVEM